MKRFLRILMMFSAMFFAVSSIAQVTTSSMSGRVSDNNGSLPGATVLVKHIPSGTTYGTVTNNDGRYTIQGMRVGGPYTVEISYVGYHTTKYENIQLYLGETYILNIKLVQTSQELSGVEIFESKTLASEKTGASMNIGTKAITALPTITREISDFTRLNPQSNGSGNFAGRDSRYNNFTVDGAAFNNNFGLSSGLPGGGSPISIDALEEITVNVSSFDIRQSSFTGANINAVTRSGDNQFKGSVYTFLRPYLFTGNHIGENEVAGANDSFKQLYGARIGGPIIKDKLFFFVSGEYEKENAPSTEMAWNPSTDGVGDAGTFTARTTVADLQSMKDLLLDRYGFNPGEFQDRGNFKTASYRILARVDWNINQNHKLTIRYNDVKTSKDIATNANSAPNPRGAARNSINSIAFTNSNYTMDNIVRSITGELNSLFSSKISNKLLLSYTHIADKRSSPLDGTAFNNFPFVDIYKDGEQYMTFGYELFTKNNAVINNVANITDNVSFYLGNHTVTAGLSFDYLYFKNSYLRYATGYYRYASMEDFIADATPMAYGLTYGYGGNDAPGAELSFGFGAIYGQDEWSINDNFRLTYGLRVELPFYLNKLEDNPSNYKDYEFADGRKIDLAQWPGMKPLFSPRVGFNWDIFGDQTLHLRGGSGLFTGMLPFVWFTNQPTNAGVLQNTVELVGANVPTDLKFMTNYKDVVSAYPNIFPANPGEGLPGSFCFVDPEFKLPQIWRSNLAVDYELPWDMILTLEGVFSKDLNVVVQENVNEAEPSSTIIDGNGNERDSWYAKDENGVWKSNNRINKEFSYAMMLTNAKQGYQYALTAQLDKKFSYGFNGLVAYTYTVSKDLTTNPGSAANSAWSSNSDVNSLNSPELGYSNFSIPHRVVGALTYTNVKNGFSVGVYYSGNAQDRYSYTYSNDMNGDGNSSDLMYIPKDASEITFVDVKNADGDIIMSAEDQGKALMNYIDNDKYLSQHKGEYAGRFASVGPWLNRFDAKVLVDLLNLFGNNPASSPYKLELSFDFKNIGNLFSSTFGAYQTHGLASYNNIRLLTFKGMEAGGDNPT
ncbi:carboxypeptidase regulatory-like domain-containing protein, partial [Bacteroidales bacterium OttesenSCG-928-K03]|nr:carboxypeptidase regulatory-like domain-containing protein [Bacteroidales bacterium OttesenSCG-928-K03]